jgi:hypothetical protein
MRCRQSLQHADWELVEQRSSCLTYPQRFDLQTNQVQIPTCFHLLIAQVASICSMFKRDPLGWFEWYIVQLLMVTVKRLSVVVWRYLRLKATKCISLLIPYLRLINPNFSAI